MKLFIDTANLDHIREAASWGVISGVTTNPSLIAREGRDFLDVIAEICAIVDGPVSAEVVAEDADTMVRQGRALAGIHPNVVVKVPLTEQGIAATRRLADEGIRVNVTLCFQAGQALLAGLAGAAYVSPFLGRLDDIGSDGVALIEEIAEVYAADPDIRTQILAASIRHPQHVVDVARAGADVATVPYAVLKKLFLHPLTDRGNEAFTRDWATTGIADIVGHVEAWRERLARRG